MIGLGSNRLSVCRRGGMSVTQAGRGGMEWLAGIRYPDWASPYSAQATAYLLQHYPTHFIDICRYGKSHQDIVPYVNANPTIGLFAATYDGFGDMIINNANDLSQMTFETPLYPTAGMKDKYRMWQYRKGRPTDWYKLSDIVSRRDWKWLKGGFGNYNAGNVGTDIRSYGSPFCIIKFFLPTTMPTGYQYTRADGGSVYVNGIQITTSQYNGNYDFSGKITLNQPNFVAVTCNGSNNWGTAMGFKFS